LPFFSAPGLWPLRRTCSEPFARKNVNCGSPLYSYQSFGSRSSITAAAPRDTSPPASPSTRSRRHRDRVAAEDALHDERLARAAAAGQEHLGEPEQAAELGVEVEVALDDLANAIENSGSAGEVIAEPLVEEL
jgi:hypothetical protein